jgi:hypothetical protein
MNRKNKNKDKHIKYQYLIWKSGEGFMHLDRFSKDELSTFLKDMEKIVNEPETQLEKIKNDDSNDQ